MPQDIINHIGQPFRLTVPVLLIGVRSLLQSLRILVFVFILNISEGVSGCDSYLFFFFDADVILYICTSVCRHLFVCVCGQTYLFTL